MDEIKERLKHVWRWGRQPISHRFAAILAALMACGWAFTMATQGYVWYRGVLFGIAVGTALAQTFLHYKDSQEEIQ